MRGAGLTRRTFLRLSALTTASTIAAACDLAAPEQPSAGNVRRPPASTGSSQQTDTPHTQETSQRPEGTPPPALRSPVRLELDGGSSDVWAWRRRVTGTIVGDCEESYLLAGYRRIELRRDGALFSAQVPFGEGTNEVTVVCGTGAGKEERSAVSTFTVRLKRRPTAVVQIAIEDGSIVLDGSTSQPDEAGGARITRYHWAPRAGNPAPLVVKDGQQEGQSFTGERVLVAPPTADGEYYLTLRVVDADGREDVGASYFVVEGGRPRVPDYDKEAPAWVDHAIIYGVIPRKFGDPAFAGIVERLDYLKDLGINALWLSPINRSPGGDFGYAVVDYFDVNPDFGTRDDFRKMVEEAHARGIRVLIDFVPNHSSAEHPYYQDVQARGKESAYYDFYDRDESGKVTHYFDWEHLPNLNYDNPEVEHFMLEAFSYWVRDFDVDGFRVDVAWGIKERKPDFWPRWRRELKRIKPDLLLLAEATARDPYYFDNGFDAAYDWTAQLGKWAWEIVWEAPELLTYNLHAALTNNGTDFHPRARIFRFLNNNDTGTRFITTHGEELARVAAAMLLTLPGVPCVYTGDEIGAWYRPYFDTMPLVWDENKYPGLLDHYKRLTALRKALPALHSPHWQPLETEPSQQVYAYLRYLEPADRPVLVLLNFSDEAVEASLVVPAAFVALKQAETLWDLLADEPVPVQAGEDLRIMLPPTSARIIAREVDKG